MTDGAARDVVIEARSVSREFVAADGPVTLFRVLRDRWRGVNREAYRRLALGDISFTISRGEKVAVLGRNGAGKSTLLKVVAGLLRPTAGSIEVAGELALVTSLGAGMIDEVSIIDNTLLYGALFGVDPVRLRAALPEIFAWAEIDGSHHARLKTLSTGTRARLAFSVVRHIDAGTLLIDEGLSAGDAAFQAKCRASFDEPRNQERTFLVATHDMEFARSFCRRALWLDAGRLVRSGDSTTVVSEYLAAQRPARATAVPAR